MRCISQISMVPSPEPEISVDSSGEKNSQCIVFACPSSVMICSRVAMSHSVMVRSDPTTIVVPSDEYTTEETPWRCDNEVISSPDAASQSLTSEPDAEANVFRSGENTTLATPPRWPLSVAFTSRVAISHNLTVLSREPEANVFPSGENASVWVVFFMSPL